MLRKKHHHQQRHSNLPMGNQRTQHQHHHSPHVQQTNVMPTTTALPSCNTEKQHGRSARLVMMGGIAVVVSYLVAVNDALLIIWGTDHSLRWFWSSLLLFFIMPNLFGSYICRALRLAVVFHPRAKRALPWLIPVSDSILSYRRRHLLWRSGRPHSRNVHFASRLEAFIAVPSPA